MDGPEPASEPSTPRGARAAAGWMVREFVLFGPIAIAATFMAVGVQRLWPAGPPWSLAALHAALLSWVAIRERPKLGAWLAVRARDVALGAAGGALLLAVGVSYGAALDLVGARPPDMAALIREWLPSPVIRLAWGGVLVPLAEELFFRGRLADALVSRVGVRVAAVATSVLFALAHGIPILMPAHALFGAILFGLRRRTRGLTAPIAAHALNNAVGLLWG